MPQYSSALNLSLSQLPDDNVKPEVALAIAPLHYAMHSLHKGVSQLTGAWQPAAAEWPTITPDMTLFAANRRKIYLTAAVNFLAGQTFYITGAGQAALATATAAGTLAQGWATQPVTAGQVGEFVMFEGLLQIAGAVAGTKYYQADAAGTLAAAPGTVPQPVGIGIAANLIYVRIAV